MVEVRWSPQAVQDLDSIIAFISGDSTEYARIFVVDVFEALDRIGAFPKSGRIVPELSDPNVRELILGNYRIIYRLKEDHAGLVTIHHGARQLDPKKTG
ncbi:MAG: type II toxin-antitoxin system RelE/ParE family toxin [Elusimicrobia bacterium]|nr:type II toxin-antitoxin system RelE/ParE family toxin [Elusimicrobiota bacterium]